jgi:hypothetical protein
MVRNWTPSIAGEGLIRSCFRLCEASTWMSGNANLLRRRRTATSGAPNAEGGSTLAISAPWLITPGRCRIRRLISRSEILKG